MGNPLHAQVGERRASISDGVLHVFDGDTEIGTLDGFYGELGGVFFTDDGRVGASEISPTHIWSLATGQTGDDVTQPVTNPDGTRRATFGNDGVIRLIDAASGDEIAALHGHIRAVTAVAFSPDGRLLASASNDGTIMLWDANAQADSGSLAVLRGHNGGVASVAFNAEGTLLASAGYDGTRAAVGDCDGRFVTVATKVGAGLKRGVLVFEPLTP